MNKEDPPSDFSSEEKPLEETTPQDFSSKAPDLSSTDNTPAHPVPQEFNDTEHLETHEPTHSGFVSKLLNPLIFSWIIFGIALLAVIVWLFQKPAKVIPEASVSETIAPVEIQEATKEVYKPPATEDSWSFAKIIPAIDLKAPKGISFLITDVGVDPELMAALLENLPQEISLAFNPYIKDLPQKISKAKAKGFPVLLGLPFEPYDLHHTDPGPLCLMSDVERDTNLYRLHVLMAQAQDTKHVGDPLIEGVVSTYGQRLSTSSKDLAPILRHLKVLGLYFIEGEPTIFSEVPSVCQQEETTCRIVDANLTLETLLTGDKKLGDLIHRPGGVILKISAFELNKGNIPLIQQRLNYLKTLGIPLVKLQTLIKKPSTPEAST